MVGLAGIHVLPSLAALLPSTSVVTCGPAGVPNFEQRPVLCPGRYRIASCETNEADYDYRVERVREAVLSVRGITDVRLLIAVISFAEKLLLFPVELF